MELETGGAEATRLGGPTCRWCPLSVDCPEGRAELAAGGGDEARVPHGEVRAVVSAGQDRFGGGLISATAVPSPASRRMVAIRRSRWTAGFMGAEPGAEWRAGGVEIGSR